MAADDLRRITVEVPEWGGAVALRVLTGAEQEWFLDFVGPDASRAVPLLRETLVAMTLCDECGGRLFSTDEVTALAGKASEILQRLFVAASELNGLAATALETAVKNSVVLPGDDSGISSPVRWEGERSANGNPV